MKKLKELVKNNSYFYLDTIYIFILNILLGLLLFKSIGLISFVFYLLESVFFGAIINLIISLFKGKLPKFINFIFLLFIGIIFTGQFVHYHFYDCFFSFYSLIHSGQVFAFYEAIVKIILENIWGFLLFIFSIIIFSIFNFKFKYSYLKVNMFKEIGYIFISLVLFIIMLFIPFDKLYSPYNLLTKTHNGTLNVKTFGLVTSSFIDVNRYIFGFNPCLIEESDNEEFYDSDKYNVLDTDFDNIVSNENSNIKVISNYLQSTKPSNKNGYTGIFKDKNLIFITAESFDFNIISKEVTPTLYKLYNEGITFNNYYTPIYYASTSDGEYTNLTSLLPKEGVWSYMYSLGNSFPYSYANMFKGYNTYSYHNGMYDFYDRYLLQKNFGFSSFRGCGNGLEKDINCDLWPQSDEEMFDKTFGDYKNDKHFVSYFMSISGHLSHNFNTNDMAYKNKDLVKNLNYSDNVKAYISGNIDLDKGLSKLINHLEENDLLDDTVIVITPDHFPYGLTRGEIKELQKLDNPYDLFKSNLIIYNKGIKPVKVDKYSSNIDVLPTLLNMFDIRFDSRLLIGRDIMSDEEGIVIFNDGSFLNEKGFYNNKTSKCTYNSKDLENVKYEVYNKINVSSLILNNDYYKYIK